MHSSYLFANGLRTHYLRWDGGEGQPVVLLHNLGSNARAWEQVAARLDQAGLAPLVPDLRGHGLTDQPETGYTLPELGRDLAACLEAWNVERPLLVGFGWSATLVLDYAARLPAGPRAPVGVILIDGGLFEFDHSPEGVPPAAWEAAWSDLYPPWRAGLSLDEFLDSLALPPAAWRPDDTSIPALLADFEIDSEERLKPRLAPDHRQALLQEWRAYPSRQNLARLRCPVLALQVDSPTRAVSQPLQAAMEEDLERARTQLPRLQTGRLENGVPYYAPLQQPDVLAAKILAFIRQNIPGQRPPRE